MDSTKKDFYEKYDYNERSPHFIKREELTDQQFNRLVKSDKFCMLPWVHMHAFPDGRAYPCCLGDYWHPVGDLRKHTMEEVWNQDAYKTMRKNMLEDKSCKECTKCYEQEANGFFSMRNDANRNYGHLINEVDQTASDGEHPEFKLRYWDVRFSNMCNFRCRSCGPIFSSNWYKDHVKLYGVKPDVLKREMAVIEYTTGNEEDMLKQMEPHIEHLEQVYFAGGEPMIMKEHYYLLERLIDLGKTDVRLVYNTNFSEMRYKDKHVFDYWKHFKTVNVGASLDGMGSQGELIRKGQDWAQTEENRIRMKEEVPHVDFYVSATVTSQNVLHVLDFHRDWVERGFINPQDFNVNICQSPEWYRIDIFPEQFKREVIEPAYRKHIEWLDPQDKLRRATTGFESAINFMMSNDGSKYWNRFEHEIKLLDDLRNEDFWATFPELEAARGKQ
jgi:radical SAM protein with 4Fe4S-binding SPASM domain